MDAGSFARVRVDDPGRIVLYANQQGGFRVTCPDEGRNVVPAFSAALTAWKRGGPRSMSCSCGRSHALERLSYEPDAAFGSAALIVANVASTRPSLP